MGRSAQAAPPTLTGIPPLHEFRAAAFSDSGAPKHAGTVTGLINGCGSVGAILGGLLPGYLSTSTLFYGFAAAAFIAMLLLIPHWNRMPAAD